MLRQRVLLTATDGGISIKLELKLTDGHGARRFRTRQSEGRAMDLQNIVPAVTLIVAIILLSWGARRRRREQAADPSRKSPTSSTPTPRPRVKQPTSTRHAPGPGCDLWAGDFRSYVDDKLVGYDRERFEGHMTICDLCTRAFEEHQDRREDEIADLEDEYELEYRPPPKRSEP